MDQQSIAEAVKQICDEKGVPLEAVIATIEAALAAAYRKDFGEKNQNIKVEFDLNTGKIEVFDVKLVVEDLPPEVLAQMEAEKLEREETKKSKKEEKKEIAEKIQKDSATETAAEGEEIKRFNSKTEIQLKDAILIKKDAQVAEEIKTELPVHGDFGRMAAQTAKQVIIQKLRETEREALFAEYKGREGEIVVGTVQRREGSLVLIDLGRITALLPPEEQIRSENYMPGSHFKVYIVAVTTTTKGPEVIVSRSHPEIVKKLFALEIPEVASGVVQIKAISREAGSRTKIAVWTDQENIDPIGSCIGQRGARIQTIISELKGEKVDIIKYSDDPAEFITNALSPAKITQMKIDEEHKIATAKVAENQLSLAIGKAGQNVRLAAKLTGWKIDIISTEEKIVEEGEESAAKEGADTAPAEESTPQTPVPALDETKSEETEEKKDEEKPAKAEKKTKKTKTKKTE